MSDDDRIAKLEREIEMLQQTVSRMEERFTEAFMMVAQVSTTQSQQFARVMDLLTKVSSRQDEFERWRSEISTPRLKVPSVRRKEDLANSLAMTTKALQTYFNDEELRDLAMEMSVPIRSLAGESHNDLCREFVDYLRRRNRFWDMVRLGREMRPHALWPTDTGPLS